MENFVHLHVHSPYSFQDGASSIEDLVKEAAAKGMSALAITDHDNVSAAVRFARLAQQSGIKPLQGAEVTTAGGHHLTLLARDDRGRPPPHPAGPGRPRLRQPVPPSHPGPPGPPQRGTSVRPPGGIP
ncbi:MAG: PHP domain-containing protein [Peptococcaceae bacterium]|nr:PHP domain-containing protein [Peptococcaceae bacterium]